MSERDPNAPSLGTLRHLKGMLPSFVEGLANKRIGGKGKAAPGRNPHKICKVCVSFYDYSTAPVPEHLESGFCPECDKFMRDGYIAFACGDRRLFGKSERMKDCAGTVMEVSPEVMDQLAKVFEAEWNVKADVPETKANNGSPETT